MEAYYAAQWKEYEQRKADYEERQVLTSIEIHEYDEIDEEIHSLHSQQLVRLAERYFLPVPEFKAEGGEWERTPLNERWVLRREALVELRAAIRREQKDRRELRQMNLIWITALTGVIGALTGLVVALHHR
jgi:hypothetical protein